MNMININQAQLLIFSEFLFIVMLFLMFVLRMCFFLFVARTDPARVLTDLLNPGWLRKHNEKKKIQENTEKFS